MNDKTLHEIVNELHQIIGYAELLCINPQKYRAYSDLIKQSTYLVDTLISQPQHSHDKSSYTSPTKDRTVMIKNLLEGKSILIVDDIAENQVILKDIFSVFKCNIECVENARDALNLFKHFKPDIVCMDIIMPGIKGDEATRLLKEEGCTAKFIAVSALKEYSGDYQHLFDDWLPKPFTIDQLFDIVISLDLSATQQQTNPSLHQTLTLNDISKEIKKEIIISADKGALSELEFIVDNLPDGNSKEWLHVQLSNMNLEAIQKSINEYS